MYQSVASDTLCQLHQSVASVSCISQLHLIHYVFMCKYANQKKYCRLIFSYTRFFLIHIQMYMTQMYASSLYKDTDVHAGAYGNARVPKWSRTCVYVFECVCGYIRINVLTNTQIFVRKHTQDLLIQTYSVRSKKKWSIISIQIHININNYRHTHIYIKWLCPIE